MKRDCGHEWRNNDFDCIECVEAKLRRYEGALEQIRDGLFRYNMGDYEICAKNAAQMALENHLIFTQSTAAAPADNDAESWVCVCPITPSERCQIHAALVAKRER